MQTLIPHPLSICKWHASVSPKQGLLNNCRFVGNGPVGPDPGCRDTDVHFSGGSHQHPDGGQQASQVRFQQPPTTPKPSTLHPPETPDPKQPSLYMPHTDRALLAVLLETISELALKPNTSEHLKSRTVGRWSSSDAPKYHTQSQNPSSLETIPSSRYIHSSTL